MPQGHSSQLARAPRRRRDPASVQADFDHYLDEAERLSCADLREDALDRCWSARRLAKREGLERVGEADLAIGLALFDLDRMNEGLEAVHRAVRYFAQRGQLRLRGCGEALLAEAALRRGEEALAERHLQVAGDLLFSSGGAREVAWAFSAHARRLEECGEPKAAAVVRRGAKAYGPVTAAVV